MTLTMGKAMENTENYLKEQLKNSSDVTFQTVKKDQNEMKLIYIKTICDPKEIRLTFMKPFFEMEKVGNYIDFLTSLEGYKEYKNNEETLKHVLSGHVIIFLNNQIITVQNKLVVNKSVQETKVETTIQGPHMGLSEDLITNINLIRNRYNQSTLKVESESIGSVNEQSMMLVYDVKFVSEKTLTEIRDRVKEIRNKKEVVQSAGEIHRLLSQKKANLFPIFIITERPDRIAYNLSKGKVIILLEGQPFVVIAPAVFYDFMSAMEDMYFPFWISKFLIALRYLGLFVSILLPAAYVAVTAYNPEVFRVQLTLSVAASRMGVPYPSFIEVLFMLLSMELLIEASLRLPKTIGPTATTVGGLILGTAATEAGLVSNIMIIIVSAVAISNFVVPINEMGFAMRVVKYLLLLISIFFGLTGLVGGFILVLCYLIRLDSFGMPYLRIFFSENKNPAI